MPVTFPPGRARLDTNPLAHRVAHVAHDDGNRRRRALGRADALRACCHDAVHVEANQVTRVDLELIEVLGRAINKGDAVPLDVAKLDEPLAQDLEEAAAHLGNARCALRRHGRRRERQHDEKERQASDGGARVGA